MITQSIIVPKISTVPVHEPRARAILRWLVREKVSGTLNDANDYARSLGYYSTGSQLMLVVNQHTVQPLNIALGGIN